MLPGRGNETSTGPAAPVVPSQERPSRPGAAPAASRAVTRFGKRPAADLLRDRLDHRRTSIAAVRAKQDAEIARLEQAVADAERQERIEAARAELMAQAERFDLEAARLGELVAKREAIIAQADDDLASLASQASAVREKAAAVERHALEMLPTRPERSAALLASNLGRTAALERLDRLAAEAESRRRAAQEGTGPDDSLQHLKNLLTNADVGADRLRRQASEDPLGEGEQRRVDGHNRLAAEFRATEAARLVTPPGVYSARGAGARPLVVGASAMVPRQPLPPKGR